MAYVNDFRRFGKEREMNKYNCCNNLSEVVEWFKGLKNKGISKDDILDCLEFDGDQFPNMEILKEAREIVYA